MTILTQIQDMSEDLQGAVILLDRELREDYQPDDPTIDIGHLYSLQTALHHLDATIKKITKMQAHLRPILTEEIQKRVDAKDLDYDEYTIVPVTKITNRSVDENLLKQYYKSFYDSIIAAKTAVLERTYKVSIKDVETFMGSLAEKVILQGEEVLDTYEIQKKG
jgi:hypothetical protein